jgi:hypothetical protein
MKRFLLTLGIVVVALVLVYFAMWYFLSQTYAVKVVKLLQPVAAALDSSSAEEFADAFKKSKGLLDGMFKPEDRSPFSEDLRKAFNRFEGDILALPDPSLLSSRISRLSFYADVLNVALSRALYEDRSVPLGAVKQPLLRYVKSYDMNADMIESNTNMQLTEKVIKNYRNYLFILKGKKEVLQSYLTSGNKIRVLVALDEIEKNKVKGLESEVETLFRDATDEEVKFESVKTAMAFPKYKNQAMEYYIISSLQEGRANKDLIELAGQTHNTNYLPFLAQYTNKTASEEVRDAALTAMSRIKVK